MKKMYTSSIFLFHRDLRIKDVLSLNEAASQSERVYPLFILDTRQIGTAKEEYQRPSVQFMIESLEDLDRAIQNNGSHLSIGLGLSTELLKNFIKKNGIEAVFSSIDYTPFAKKRDRELQKITEQSGAQWHQYHDALLVEPEAGLKDDGDPYVVFTPFYNKVRMQPVCSPKTETMTFAQKRLVGSSALQDMVKKILPVEKRRYEPRGGRQRGLAIFRSVEEYAAYKDERDVLALDATTHLAAHHKFGTISIRESVHYIKKGLGPEHALLRQLYWREFFTHVAFHFPHVFGKEFQEKMQGLRWSKDRQKFALWCEGKTGLPIVDAGMRELNETGHMHNRARMIVASFLTKDLRIDWRMGEKYFADHLVDYDPCVNNGSWQWAASTGVDAQPYFRIFNPWLQQKKFDPACVYIKRWIPELRDLDPTEIHHLYKGRNLLSGSYPAPMVDHKEEAKKTIDWFKEHIEMKKEA